MKEERTQNNSNSIVTGDEIKNILNNYHIGKKPLAKLLGWGETTIIRYIEGDTPTTEYSNKLREIANEPAYYYDLLLKNKDNLTNVAFRKSKNAVLEKIMESKISLVAQYIIHLIEGEVGALYIQAILYYSQAFSLALYDKEIFPENYGVNSNNIPYFEIYESMRKYGVNVLELPGDRLTSDEMNLIKNVTDAISWYGPKGIRTAMATERANFRISRDKDNSRIISKEIIKRYFQDVLVQYDISNENEIYKYIDKKIIEIKHI
jgi:hypothetical protein